MIAVILLSGLFNISCASYSKKMVLEDMSNNAQLNQPDKMIQWLKECRLKCVEPDNQVADKMSQGYEGLFAVAKENSNYQSLNSQQKEKAEQSSNLLKQAFVQIMEYKENRDTILTAYGALSDPNSQFYIGNDNVKEIGEKTSERLRLKSKTASTGWYLKSLIEKETLKSIHALKECLTVDAKDVQCRSDYQKWVSVYQRPWCKGKDVSSEIQFKMKGVVGNKKNEYIFSAKSIVNSYLSEDTVALTLKSDRFQDMLERLTSGAKEVELTIIKRGVAAPVGILKLLPQSSRVSVGFPRSEVAKDLFSQICTTQVVNPLPEDLKIN